MNSSLQVTFTHSPREDTTHQAGPRGGLHLEQSEQVGAWEADFVVTRGWGQALVPTGGCDGLVWIIQWADRELKPATQE